MNGFASYTMVILRGRCLVLAGCSLGDAKHGTVSGTVSFDGQPLQSGSIRFTPEGGHSRRQKRMITAGKFVRLCRSAICKVAISARKVIGKT